MDFWVVAAAAGAGFLAKYLSGESESSSGNSTQQSDFRDLLQQIRDQTCPFRRLSRRRLERESSKREDDISDGQFNGASTSGSDATILANVGNYETYDVLMMTSLLPEFQGKEGFEENSVERNEDFHNFGDGLPEFDTKRLPRSRSLRSRSHEFYAKPLNSLESCLTAQLYRDQERGEDYLIRSIPSSLTQTVSPLLVTDGNRRMIRETIDSLGRRDGGKEHKVMTKGGISLEETSSTSLGTHSPQQIGRVELPRKPEQRHGKGQLSSSNTRLSVGPFHSQGSLNGILLFFIGITIGIISAVAANKKEIDNRNDMLKRSENLVRDLQEELEMKAMLTVKEIAGEYHQSQVTTDCSSRNPEPVASSSKQESAKHERKEPDDQEDSNELMSKIEAELEAELERLELNMKASTLQRISDFVELDPDFEAEVIQGELKVGLVQSLSDSDASWTPADHTYTANYAVSPRELSLRLHEVIESRLESRIEELEAALQNSQKKVHSLKWQHLLSQTNVASSMPGSPNFINEVPEMDQPFEINFSGGGSDSHNEAYDEIIRVADSDQETPDAVHGSSHIEEAIPRYNERFGEAQNKGCDNVIRKSEERILRSPGSIEVGKESEDGVSDDEFLIRQIVEKSRQGLSLVLNSY